MRTRLSQLRATYRVELDADPALTKQLAEAEEMLKDAARSEEAAKQIEAVLETLASEGFAEGLNAPVLGVGRRREQVHLPLREGRPRPAQQTTIDGQRAPHGNNWLSRHG